MIPGATSFAEFVRNKGIDAEAFQKAFPDLYAQYSHTYDVGGANMLEYGKKFFWNDLRIEFPIGNTRLQE
jgi:hypothetical protein